MWHVQGSSQFSCAVFGSSVATGPRSFAGDDRLLAVADSTNRIDVWRWLPVAGTVESQPRRLGYFDATASDGGDDAAGAVQHLAWRGDVLLAGGSGGRLAAWDTSRTHGAAGGEALDVRLVLTSAVDGDVACMAWDAVGREGMVLSASGSIW